MWKFYFLLISILISHQIAIGQKAKYHSDIIYRLSSYVEWPTEKTEYKFVLGVIGNVMDFRSFQKLALEKHNINQLPIEVRYFDRADHLEECQLLYISEKSKVSVGEIIKKTEKYPILIISGNERLTYQGTVLNFVETEGWLKLNFNKIEATKRGLHLSDQLEYHAILNGIL